MNIKQLDEQVSVSDQCSCDALAQLAETGVKLLVCNRLEGESEDQPSYAEMKEAAERSGMAFIAIPFARGRMTSQHCRAFADILARGDRVHAYCRTGNRSCNLWAGARLLAGADRKVLLGQARHAGFDIGGVLVAMDPE
ncbi:TIGR01244 family sulfur transferase [Microbulbifer taiwanensis]|uniref:TIGR01244 family sulfur transferase n=1 Tax=Microbulbifer taiwanensis TaxID=986746 RepID=A0ABW1YS94_9GAMM|nr:TIGR01244 family sulfur transferase [Microbulbifer taiwanensis]